MSEQLDYLLGFVKGDFAESLVRNLFRGSSYKAETFGEWKVATTTGQAVKSEIGNGRSDHPDLKISGRGTTPCFFEVKFRTAGHVRRKLHADLVEQSAYWSRIHPVSVILVNCLSKPYFNVVDLGSAKETRSRGIVYEKTMPLMQAGWQLDPVLYKAVECLVESAKEWR